MGRNAVLWVGCVVLAGAAAVAYGAVTPSAHYPLEEGPGNTTFADAQGGLSGTIAGTEGTHFQWDSPGMPAGHQQKLHFNIDGGTSSSATIPDQASLDAGSAVTVSVWFNRDPVPGGTGWQGILGKRGTTTNYGLNLNTDSNAFQWYFNDGSGFRVVNPGWVPSPGVDRLFTGTLEQVGSNVVSKAYLSGIPVAAGAFGETLSTAQNNVPVTLGASFGSAERFRGTVDNLKVFNSDALSPPEVRALYEQETGTRLFSLADVVGGGNGWGTGVNQGIDPTDGSIETSHVQSLTGDGVYHAVGALSFVDGVFIPDDTSQLDSAGNTYALPGTNNLTWDHVWNSPVGGSDLNGIDFNTAGHSMIALHSNKGITFDLDEVRLANPGWTITEFRSLVGGTSSGTSDYWVFLDGQLMASRIRSPANVGYLLEVPIGLNDRFLTLVSTDGGDGYGSDQVFFGDPYFEMYIPEPSTLLIWAGLAGLGIGAGWRRRKKS